MQRKSWDEVKEASLFLEKNGGLMNKLIIMAMNLDLNFLKYLGAFKLSYRSLGVMS